MTSDPHPFSLPILTMLFTTFSMRIKMTAALDVEEKQIRAGTHPGLLAELKAIEDRRKARIDIARAQKGYAERMWEKNYQAVRKAAFDQYKV